MKFVKMVLVSCAMVGLLAACSWAAVDNDEMVPQNAKSAKDVVSKLQQQGATNIRHIEFDNNQWNVKTQHGQKEVQHQIDAQSGEITGKQEESEYENAPPSNVLGILEVINVVRGQGFNGIREVEYDDSLWKVEVVQDGKVTKLCLDPIAGDVIWKDTQPLKESGETSDDESGTDASKSEMKSKIEKVKDAIKERFMKDKSNQDQSTNQGSGSQSGQSSNTQGSSSQSGSSSTGSSSNQNW